MIFFVEHEIYDDFDQKVKYNRAKATAKPQLSSDLMSYFSNKGFKFLPNLQCERYIYMYVCMYN